MSYRIEYGKNPKYRISPSRKKWTKATLVLSLMAVAAAGGFYTVQVIGLQNLLPGDPAVTGAALDAFIESWQDGVPIADAFTVFCQEIVDNAQIIH